MIEAVLVLNDKGQPRLTKFYVKGLSVETQTARIRQCYNAVVKRDQLMCNFLDASSLGWPKCKVVYRKFATLYFIFVVDESESELGTLDLIHIFVEVLDHCFSDVCELDLIFHMDQVHYALDEIVMGGMVLETQKDTIVKAIEEQKKLGNVDSVAATAVKKLPLFGRMGKRKEDH